ncbi:hypothetical protein TNCV_3484061 [Trichonephila clavipes]|nr:hypothetical protein TNCV_3484061 [Trichonephila clavipes]
MIVGARNVGTSNSKTAALVKCSRTAMINLFREWIIKQKTGSQCQVCCHHRLQVRMLSRKGELPKLSSPTEEQSQVKLRRILITEELRTCVFERNARRTVLTMVVNDLFESLYCRP